MKENENTAMELQSLVTEEDTTNEKEHTKVNYRDKMKGFIAAMLFVIFNTFSATCCQLLERRIPRL